MTGARLGLRENLPQFTLLVFLNAFVGAMVGLERTVLPLLGEQEFGLSSKTAITSFIVSFGVTKAILNLVAARVSDRIGRKPVLVTGWLFALPVPFLIIYAPVWWWIDLANVLLGANQALAWSMTVVMKVDLVGPRRRGLALGLNEFAGYFAVGVTSWATGYIAAHWALRPQPFYLGIGIALIGLGLSLLFVRETRGHAQLEAATAARPSAGGAPSLGGIFYATSLGNVSLFAVCQAGLVNNLNDGMSWGIYPLFFAAYGLGVQQIGVVKAVYPGVWGILQVVTGPLSDRLGRKGLIAGGMVVLASRRRPAGSGHRHGVSHLARGRHRPRPPGLAREQPRCLPVLARPRLCGGRPHLRRRGRSLRVRRGDPSGRGPDIAVGPRRGVGNGTARGAGGGRAGVSYRAAPRPPHSSRARRYAETCVRPWITPVAVT